MNFRNRPPLAPRHTDLTPWAEADSFADFESQVDRGSSPDLVQRGAIDPRQATRDMFMRDEDKRPFGEAARYLAQAGVGGTAAKEPSPAEKLRFFQTYMKQNYNVSDEDAGRILGVYGAWQANPLNWGKGTALDVINNVNGQISPAQDRMTRSVINSARNKELRDRIMQGYDKAIQGGEVKIVDDPTKR